MRFQPSQHSHTNPEAYGNFGGFTYAFFKVGDDLYRVDDSAKTAILVLSKGSRVMESKDYDAVKTLLAANKAKKISVADGTKLIKAAKAATVVSTGLSAALLSKTWNDGQYTYAIDRNGNITIGTKVFKKGDAKYAAVVATLNKDYADGKLSQGAAPEKPKVAYTPPPMPVSMPAAAAPTTESGGGSTALFVMEQPWFWPAVIGGTVVAGGAIWYFFLRTPAAPAGAPA